MLPRFVLLAVALVSFPAVSDGEEPAIDNEAMRGAITKSLPLLTAGARGHREHRTCFACHNQGVPILALTAAKARGFVIDDEELGRQLQFIADFLATNREQYLQGKGQGGQADTAGYALLALDAAGWQADETTAAVSEYLLQRHDDKSHWTSTSNRPPSEASPFTTSYVALRGLDAFWTPEQLVRIGLRRRRVRQWLIVTAPQDHEDRVFRLLALAQVKAPTHAITAAAEELRRKQRPDGGWAQLDQPDSEQREPAAATNSDAYATGTALVSLHQAGGLATSDPVYQRGLRYLLDHQQADGSWHVASRSKPFQAYFETGFPHGKDQFISCGASAWATLALVLGFED